MTREEYLEYVNDQTKDITPVLFFFYRLKGGHLNEHEFNYAIMRYLAYIGGLRFGQLFNYVFTQLDFHFKLRKYDKRLDR